MIDLNDFDTYLERISFLKDINKDNIEVTRLHGGLTNINYLFDVYTDNNIHSEPINRYVVRIPGEGTSEYINRKNEKFAAESASLINVNAKVLYFDELDGLMVTKFVERSITMNSQLFKDDISKVIQAGRLLHDLHTKSCKFPTDFKLFDMIEEYQKLLAAKETKLPDGYLSTLELANQAKAVLVLNSEPLVPSHCDPLCENFLYSSDTMYLIDYEYSGNNDPMWDLSDLSVEGNFDILQDSALLCGYFNAANKTQIPLIPHAKFIIYKAMVDLLWTLWGVLQYANQNPADDFWKYSVNRFQRCKTLMESDEFLRQIYILQTNETFNN